MKRWHTIDAQIFNPDGQRHMDCFGNHQLAKGLARRLNLEMDEGRKQKCVALLPPEIKGQTFNMVMVTFLENE